MGITDLPAGLTWKSRDLHAVRCTSGTRSSTFISSESIAIASSTSELNCQALTHEVRTVKGYVDCYCVFARGTVVGLTRNDITGIHGILVFDESEAIHELDLGDLSGAMSVEMRLDIGLGSYELVSKTGHSENARRLEDRCNNLHTISREITQVQPGRRHLRHSVEAFLWTLRVNKNEKPWRTLRRVSVDFLFSLASVEFAEAIC